MEGEGKNCPGGKLPPDAAFEPWELGFASDFWFLVSDLTSLSCWHIDSFATEVNGNLSEIGFKS
jgi:hypothetical protein